MESMKKTSQKHEEKRMLELKFDDFTKKTAIELHCADSNTKDSHNKSKQEEADLMKLDEMCKKLHSGEKDETKDSETKDSETKDSETKDSETKEEEVDPVK